MRINDATPETMGGLWAKLEASVAGAENLEDAAQALVSGIYERFSDSVVLSRVFYTMPFDTLPDYNRSWVRNLAEDKQVAGDLRGDTRVLSLIGTAGEEDAWNDRHNSEGHVGIPLVSSSFIGAIPMISRLLKELGVPLEWVDDADVEIVEHLEGAAGTFYVEDAATATDEEDRKIIAAQDFVKAKGVETVFGTGTAYPSGEVLVLVCFCRDHVDRANAELFSGLKDKFREATVHMDQKSGVFTA